MSLENIQNVFLIITLSDPLPNLKPKPEIKLKLKHPTPALGVRAHHGAHLATKASTTKKLQQKKIKLNKKNQTKAKTPHTALGVRAKLETKASTKKESTNSHLALNQTKR